MAGMMVVSFFVSDDADTVSHHLGYVRSVDAVHGNHAGVNGDGFGREYASPNCSR